MLPRLWSAPRPVEAHVPGGSGPSGNYFQSLHGMAFKWIEKKKKQEEKNG